MFRQLVQSEDPDKFEVMAVNVAEMDMAYDLITREVNCKAAFQNVCNFLKLSDVELKNAPKNSFRQKWFKEHIRSKFTQILMWFYICGFCPYLIDFVWVETDEDPGWMESFKKIHDEKKEKYRVRMPIIIIPEKKTFSSKILTNRRSMISHIVCTNILYTTHTKATDLDIYTSCGYFKPPRSEDGLLQSPISSLFKPYRELLKYKSLALQASHTLANPVTFVQHADTDKNDDIAKTTNEALYAEAELHPHNPKYKDKKYLVIDARRRRQNAMTNFYRNQARTLIGEQKTYFDTGIASQKDTQKLLGVAEVLYPIDEGLQISKTNPTPAKVPEEMQELRLSFPSDVAKAFDIPNAVIGNTKAAGTGVKNYADIELKTLNATIHNLTAEMEYLFTLVQKDLMMGKGEKRIEFELHPQPFFDPDFVLEVFTNKSITDWQMDKILVDSFGFPRDPVRKPSNTTATMDMITSAMKTEEGFTGSQARKQMKVLHNVDI